MDELERTFREMRAADQMRAGKAEQKQETQEERTRPNFWQASADAAREVLNDPMRTGSITGELAYAVEDIRQKVVEAPTYGQEVTPSLHDGRHEHGGGDPLMQAYSERREMKPEDLYGKGQEQAKERAPEQAREGIER